MSEALAEFYEGVVGVDISEEMVRLQHRRRQGIEYMQITEPPLPFVNQWFDCAYSTIVVQHIPARNGRIGY